ncbi:MAG TPA: putative zinc-binding metallopeptidase, partial [Thermoanaerobaculia bacterium]|nr:putative zinc-binding metallopeptidase [Thermoanaerobaculia bacterium]
MVQFEHAPPEARQLLPVPIRELGLSLESSPVAELVRHLYAELEAKGLRGFKPLCYLSDEWGSPSGEPVIGIPFYLGDPRVANLEDAVNDVESEREIMMYLRHEAGHAFRHAWSLHRTDEFRALFGPVSRAYRDDFPFVPFSRDYVRYIPGWYAQKHPDEDFAETFAVWLDPHSHWQRRYAGWPAMRKLQYVDRIARELGERTPPKPRGRTDITVDEMTQTVEEFYREIHVDEKPMIADLALDADLTQIFSASGEQSAADLLAEHRRALVDKVNDWTGVRRTLVRELVLAIERRLRELALFATPGR